MVQNSTVEPQSQSQLSLVESRPSPVTMVQRLYALQAPQTASTGLRLSVASKSSLLKSSNQRSSIIQSQSQSLSSLAVSRPLHATTVQRLYALQAPQTASTGLKPSVESRSFPSRSKSQSSLAANRPLHATMVQRLYALQALQTALTDLRPSVASRSFPSKLLSQRSSIIQSQSLSSLAASRPSSVTMVLRSSALQVLPIVSTDLRPSVVSRSFQSRSKSQ